MRMIRENLERTLAVTKKGYPAMWVQTQRFAAPNVRYGQCGAVCSPNGKLTKIIRSLYNYTKVKSLVRLSSKCVYIEANYNIDGNVIAIYKIDKLDFENKKVILHRVAAFQDGKWDNTSYLKNYKEGVHSAIRRAKKIYSLSDLD